MLTFSIFVLDPSLFLKIKWITIDSAKYPTLSHALGAMTGEEQSAGGLPSALACLRSFRTLFYVTAI